MNTAMSQAVAERVAGMQAVDAAANLNWKEYAWNALLKVAKTNQFFMGDKITDLCEADPDAPTTHDLRAIGPLMKRAEKEGIIRNSGRHAISIRGGVKIVWESMIAE